MRDLRKIRAGVYEHISSGWVIVKTEAYPGPRGGNPVRWEHAYWDPTGNSLVVDSVFTQATLGAARDDLERQLESGHMQPVEPPPVGW
jgi:hypothetical protein